jgi:hypothetical protein
MPIWTAVAFPIGGPTHSYAFADIGGAAAGLDRE